MKFQIWMEGFAATGESAPATYCGQIEADSFIEACRMWCERNGGLDLFRVNNGVPSHWGCRFFENESDARKVFG